MRRFLFSAIVVISISTSLQAQKIFTNDDYIKAASRLGINLSKLIDRNVVRPQWMPDGNFWYSVKTATGTEYVLANVKDGKKKTAAKKDDIIPSTVEAATPVVKSTEVLSPDAKKKRL
jgi:dipeptidyl-peptidase 4